MEGAYLISTNVEHWHNLQDIQLSMLDGKEVENAGDGTCDLPGHWAKYCSYTLMDTAQYKHVTLHH